MLEEIAREWTTWRERLTEVFPNLEAEAAARLPPVPDVFIAELAMLHDLTPAEVMETIADLVFMVAARAEELEAA